MSSFPTFVSERPEPNVAGGRLRDCAYAMLMVLANKAGIVLPADLTAAREALERSDDRPDETGASKSDLMLAAQRTWDWSPARFTGDWSAFVSRLGTSAGGCISIQYKALGEPFIRFDRAFAARDDSWHEVYAQATGPSGELRPGFLWLMDPEGPVSGYHGEWVPTGTLGRAAAAYAGAGQVAALVADTDEAIRKGDPMFKTDPLEMIGSVVARDDPDVRIVALATGTYSTPIKGGNYQVKAPVTATITGSVGPEPCWEIWDGPRGWSLMAKRNAVFTPKAAPATTTTTLDITVHGASKPLATVEVPHA